MADLFDPAIFDSNIFQTVGDTPVPVQIPALLGGGGRAYSSTPDRPGRKRVRQAVAEILTTKPMLSPEDLAKQVRRKAPGAPNRQIREVAALVRAEIDDEEAALMLLAA